MLFLCCPVETFSLNYLPVVFILVDPIFLSRVYVILAQQNIKSNNHLFGEVEFYRTISLRLPV